MKRIEEKYARELFKEITKVFAKPPGLVQKFLNLFRPQISENIVTVSIAGEGTQTSCSITNGDRDSNISCFHIDRNDVFYKGPEFFTIFKEKGKVMATARTFDRGETIESVRCWMNNDSLTNLYALFDFINRNESRLEILREKINSAYPEMLNIRENNVVKEFLDSYSLWFKNGDRNVRVYYYGYEPGPRFAFFGDETKLFELTSLQIDSPELLIMLWVVQKSLPSHLKKDFPTIEFGRLADYYEEGRGIEGEFLISWDNVMLFYQEMNFDGKEQILAFIKAIRDKGFETTLRAGTSMYTLILSRSRRYGLRSEQERLSFSFEYINSAMEVRTSTGFKKAYNIIEYNSEIESLLKALEQQKID